MKNLKKHLISLRLLTLRDGKARGKYLQKTGVFKSFGDNVWWQPYRIPVQPNLIKIGDNVNIATEVIFVEHDIIHVLFNNQFSKKSGGG